MWGYFGGLFYCKDKTNITMWGIECLLNCLDEPVLMAGLKLLLTEIGIHHRLKSHESDSKAVITNV